MLSQRKKFLKQLKTFGVVVSEKIMHPWLAPQTHYCWETISVGNEEAGQPKLMMEFFGTF